MQYQQTGPTSTSSSYNPSQYQPTCALGGDELPPVRSFSYVAAVPVVALAADLRQEGKALQKVHD